MSVFLNILRFFMHKQIVCLCVYHLHCRVWSGASAADLGTGSRCLGSTGHLLHRSRWLSLQARKLRRAMRAVWHSYWGKLWVFHLPFHSQLNLWLSRMQGLYQDIVGTTGSSLTNCSHNYSSEWKSLLPGLSEIGGSVWPAVGHFFPSVVHSPLLKEIKAINSIKYIPFLKFLSAWTCL